MSNSSKFHFRNFAMSGYVYYVTFAHVLFGLLYLVAPETVGEFFIKSSLLPFSTLDTACAYWFGLYLVFYAYLFYFGSRSELASQSFFLLAGGLCTFQAIAGNAVAFIPWTVLPCSLSFGVSGWVIMSEASRVPPPTMWSSKLSSVQNAFRLYATIALLGNGLALLLFPRQASDFYVPGFILGPIGLAFVSYNSAIQMAAAALIISSESPQYLRNGFILASVLFVSVLLRYPFYASIPMYSFIGANVLGAAVF